MFLNMDIYEDFASDCLTPFLNNIPTDVRVSAHAIRRFRERTDILNIAEIYHFVDSALRWGYTVNSYKGICRQYMLNKITRGCWPITYCGLLILLSLDMKTVVTVYSLPYWFCEKAISRITLANRKEKQESRHQNRFLALCSQLFSGKPGMCTQRKPAA